MLDIKKIRVMEFACFMGFMSCGYIGKRGTSRPLTYLILGRKLVRNIAALT